MSRDFPSGANYFQVGNPSAVDIAGTALTISAWINPDDGVDTIIVAKTVGSNQNQRQYILHITGTGKSGFQVGDAAGRDFVEGNTSPTLGVWQHYCGRKNGTGANSLMVFVNGVDDGVSGGSSTSTKSMPNTAGLLEFGDWGGNDRRFNGRIAEIGIWDFALTDAEILALGKGMRPRFIQPTHLKGYWPLFGTAAPETDYSGNANHATVVGAVAAGPNPPVLPFVFPNDMEFPMMEPPPPPVSMEKVTIPQVTQAGGMRW